jgi:hypothetical protein
MQGYIVVAVNSAARRLWVYDQDKSELQENMTG